MFIEALAAGIEVESPQLRASKLARGLATESPPGRPLLTYSYFFVN